MSQTKLSTVALAVATWIGGVPAASAVGGQAAIDLLKGNTIHGVSESKVNEYYIYLAEDGTAKVFYVNLQKHDVGKWAARGGKLCFDLPQNSAKCFDVKVEKENVELGASDMRTPMTAKLSKGNSQML